MTPINIPELRRLLAAATPRPWSCEWNNKELPDAGIDIEDAIGYRVAIVEHGVNGPFVADADLIVGARNALPALLDALEDAERLLEDVPALLDALEEAAAMLRDLREHIDNPRLYALLARLRGEEKARTEAEDRLSEDPETDFPEGWDRDG